MLLSLTAEELTGLYDRAAVNLFLILKKPRYGLDHQSASILDARTRRGSYLGQPYCSAATTCLKH